ncbi:vWA domain-containing protein [Spiribacter halobius]|nr:VWA domain-containing protein [Spiribacter halobius]UEX77272.1 VWA domain-containing protein [Spiribacter halobius]
MQSVRSGSIVVAVAILLLAAPLLSGTARGAARTGVPLDIVFSIDSSGSMGPLPPQEDPENAPFYGKDVEGLRIDATRQVVEGLEPELAWVGAVSWNEGVEFTVPVSEDHARLLAALDDVPSRGGTDLDLGLDTALDLLEQSARQGARRIVVFLTDGMSTEGISEATVRRARAQGTTVFTVGLQVPEEAETLLSAVAEATGGRYFAAPDAGALQAIFESIIGQVTEVFLALEVPERGSAGEPLAVTGRLVDRDGRAVVALEPIPLELTASRPRATVEGLTRVEHGRVELLFPAGAGTVEDAVSVGDASGMVVIAGSVPGLGLSRRRMVPVTPAEAAQGTGRGRFELVVEEPSMPVGRRLAIKVVHRDDAGNPVPAAGEHALLFTLTPHELATLAGRQGAAGAGLIGTALAQPRARSLGIDAGEHVVLENAVFRIRAVFRQGRVAFSFTVGTLEPLLFEVGLEVDGRSLPVRELVGFAERAGWAERREQGLLIWANPAEIAADGEAQALLRVLTVAAEEGERWTLSCLPPVEGGARALELAASRGGTLVPPRVAPLSAGCNAIVEERITLRASQTPGTSVIEALVRPLEPTDAERGPSESAALFGAGSVVFVAVTPFASLLAAALGGVAGAVIRRYQQLEVAERGTPGYRALLGPFLIVGALVGLLFYGALFYTLMVLPWSPALVANAGAAAVLGGLAGFTGPDVLRMLRDVVFRRLGLGVPKA